MEEVVALSACLFFSHSLLASVARIRIALVIVYFSFPLVT